MARGTLPSASVGLEVKKQNDAEFASLTQADPEIGNLVASMQDDIALLDDDEITTNPGQDVTQYQETPAEAQLNSALAVSALPSEILQMFQVMQNEIRGLRQDLDAAKGQRQRSVVNRTPIVEDMLSEEMVDMYVVGTTRVKFGNKLYNLDTPNVIMPLPKVLAERLRKSGYVKRLDEIYDQ